MKKLITLMILVSTMTTFSQEAPTTTTTTTTVTTSEKIVNNPKPKYSGAKSELRLDPTYLIFAGAVSLSYEHVLNSESGVGVNLLFSSGKEINTTFSLTPYYRFYFGKKPAAGFFFEGFTMINSFQYEKFTSTYYSGNNYGYFNSTIEKKSSTDLAIGIGLGGKWITNNGIVFELSGGIGRNLLNDYTGTSAESLPSSYKIVGRGGISIGYRF